MSSPIANYNKIQPQTGSRLTIFFYLTHVKREEIGSLVQFLQKFKLNFCRIKKEKKIRASNYISQNSNFMAVSSKPISLEEFRIIYKFLTTQIIVVGIDYGNVIWNISRTQIPFAVNSTQVTWHLFNTVKF